MDQILKTKKKRLTFHIMREKFILENVMPNLPNSDEVFKLISGGGFSSIAFIKTVADKTQIRNLYASSFRVGKKTP